MNRILKLITVIVGFVGLLSVTQKAESSTCYTGTKNQGSSVFGLYQTTSSGLIFSNFPETAKINKIDVNISYRKNAGAYLKFYLKKVNATSDNWLLSNWGYSRGIYWVDYTSPVNGLQFFNNVGINGEWRLSIYHDGTYQNPNPWSDPSIADCYRCHSGAQLSS